MKLKDNTMMDAILIKSALEWKVRHPGLSNPNVEMMLQESCRDDGDRELIKICYQMMQEISLHARNAHNGQWLWTKMSPDKEVSYSIIQWITMVVGCWSGYNGDPNVFYVNGNHPDWRTW